MAKQENLDAWLERHFPGTYDVDRNLRDIHPKHFYEHKNTSIVRLKEDQVVQFEITWYKTQDNLGITTEEITEVTDRRKNETAKAREWHTWLEQAGLTRFSVGVIEQALYVLPYGESDPKTRLQYLETILKVLDAGKADQTSIFIEAMEDSVYQTELQEIIPFGHWRRKDTWQEDHTLYRIDFEYAPGQEATDINRYWRFNAMSKRSLQIKNDAFREAEKWAKGNLKAPYYVERDQYVEIGNDEADPLTSTYGFPVFAEKPDYENYETYANNLGRIVVYYHSDQQKFTDIKKTEPE